MPDSRGVRVFLLDVEGTTTPTGLAGGFRRGELTGQVYPDLPPALARWRRQGRSTFLYSSGSVLAQA